MRALWPPIPLLTPEARHPRFSGRTRWSGFALGPCLTHKPWFSRDPALSSEPLRTFWPWFSLLAAVTRPAVLTWIALLALEARLALSTFGPTLALRSRGTWIALQTLLAWRSLLSPLARRAIFAIPHCLHLGRHGVHEVTNLQTDVSHERSGLGVANLDQAVELPRLLSNYSTERFSKAVKCQVVHVNICRIGGCCPRKLRAVLHRVLHLTAACHRSRCRS